MSPIFQARSRQVSVAAVAWHAISCHLRLMCRAILVWPKLPLTAGSAPTTDPATHDLRTAPWLGATTPFQRFDSVPKPDLGGKHQCLNCSAKFFDLNKDPIV